MIKKASMLLLVAAVGMTSCVSKKKFTALQDQHTKTEADLSQAKMELASCLDGKKKAEDDVSYFKGINNKLMNANEELVVLNKKEAENLERSLESIKEKDLQISSMSQARSKKDSITLALVTSLKGSLDDINDEDIQISVDKGVVLISISDKMLFTSGSYKLNSRSKEVLAKVAKVVNDKPNMDVMVEGHTDDKGVKANNVFTDNWDLSVYRATSVVRSLQEDHGVAPERLIAAGRSSYLPVASNGSQEGRDLNRRTRIIILPKLDQFSTMVEEGMEAAK